MTTTALELRHLETLLALSECGSLSKAAERLYLTQSALSHQLKALETYYGSALVEKSVRPLRFTAIGQRLLELARAIAARPKLLMLDEIAGGLTEPEVHDLVSLIRELKADHSIIWIEHIAHALTATADTLMVLHFGAKIAEGEPNAILRSPEVRQIYLGIAADATA